MSDGAHLGVSADRALKTILGGETSPTEKEMETRDTVRARVLAAPGPVGSMKPRSYGQAADCIAKAFVLLVEADPTVLDPARKVDLYDLANAKWPGFDEWLGGATGFMVGWATNCTRWLYEQQPVRNPALLTIEV